MILQLFFIMKQKNRDEEDDDSDDNDDNNDNNNKLKEPSKLDILTQSIANDQFQTAYGPSYSNEESKIDKSIKKTQLDESNRNIPQNYTINFEDLISKVSSLLYNVIRVSFINPILKKNMIRSYEIVAPTTFRNKFLKNMRYYANFKHSKCYDSYINSDEIKKVFSTEYKSKFWSCKLNTKGKNYKMSNNHWWIVLLGSCYLLHDIYNISSTDHQNFEPSDNQVELFGLLFHNKYDKEERTMKYSEEKLDEFIESSEINEIAQIFIQNKPSGDTVIVNPSCEEIKKHFRHVYRVKNFYNDFVFTSIAAFADKAEIFSTSERNWEVKQKVVIFDGDDESDKSIERFWKSFITGLQVFER